MEFKNLKSSEIKENLNNEKFEYKRKFLSKY